MASTRREEARPKGLVRQDSSFIGTIKNFVSTPLNWFAGNEDATGKRRRAEPVIADDELSRRSKRMRITSPTPAPPPPRRSSVVPRASSVVLPSSRATLSPRRTQRTMSIDPPRRDISNNDIDMIIDNPPSPRLPFRMRSSLTPQPPQIQTRYNTEPPPLNTLISNPVFLHQPAQPRETSTPPTTTLGSLVETVRATRSPIKQQHSILSLSEAQFKPSKDKSEDAPAERALHQLDIYKTPLLPTRLRSTNVPASVIASTTPDMFKSRRSAHLVLMQDDKERFSRRVSSSDKSPVVNETKPYAGEGGMKKLLARRRQEEEDNETEESTEVKERHVPDPSKSIPPPPPSDWFSVASDHAPLPSGSGSSLRVGRAKARNHFQRPSKTRFSAVYEEEPEDNKDDEADAGERKILEEAAKEVPVSDAPVGFSFGKDTHPVQPVDTQKAKEPPIVSLPFSFAKPAIVPTPAPAPSVSAPPPSVPTPEPKVNVPEPSKSGVPNFFANSAILSTPPPPAPVLNFNATVSAPSQPVKDIENPFWDGENKRASEEKKPAQSLFAGFGNAETKPAEPATSAPFSVFGTSSALESKPVGNKLTFSFDKPAQENPPSTEPAKPAFSFGAPPVEKKAEPTSVSGATGATTSAFADSTAKGSSLFGDQPKTESVFGIAPPLQSTPSPLSFSLSASSNVASTAGPAPVSSFFGAPSTGPSTATAEAPKPLFGGGGAFSFGQAPAKDTTPSSTPFSFGGPSSVPSPAPVPEGKVAPTPAFSFGGSSTSTTSTPVADSKPTSTFSFGGNSSTAATTGETKPASLFSFGGAPSTSNAAPAQEKSATPFSFGQPSVSASAPTAPVAFSFGGGGSTSADVSNKSFMFGQPNHMAPTERPVTPPKNNDNEFRMEESPTRDLQQMNGSKTTAPLNGGFSFGIGNATSTTPGSLFGSTTASPLAAPSPFGFGSSAATNPFAPKENKPEEPKGFGGFGQTSNAAPTITTSFSFGQQKDEVPRPSTTGSFGFGTTPTTTPTNAFSFGAPSNPFGASSNAGSAPSSPSTFNQPSPFAFGAPAPAPTTNAFSFGSQPNSPATSNSGLPQGSGGFGFGQTQPSSPFSGPIALAPSTSGGGGSLFTIGAAPSAQSTGGPRQIKKLPNRRATGKR